MDPYSELQLNPARREIRLLELLRIKSEKVDRARGQIVHCNLRVVSLNDRPEYEALSYTWGSKDSPKTIVLNQNHQLSVTRNLHVILESFRQRTQLPLLWIDGLCINQQNLDERAQQVALMAEIYGSAADVSVWLGESKRTLRGFVEQAKICAALPGTLFYPFHGHGLVAIAKAFHSMIQLHNATRLNEPSWYTRTWVMQEYALARSVRFWIGARSYPVSSFSSPCHERLTDVLERLDVAGRFFKSQSTFNAFNALVETLTRVGMDINSQQKHVSLSQALTLTTQTSNSDARDNVYGILGLVDPSEARSLRPDYTISSSEVFARATYDCIVAERDLYVLELHTGFMGSDIIPEDARSWAIFIDSEGDDMALDSIDQFSLFWNGSGKLEWTTPAAPEFVCPKIDQGFQTLSLDGVLFDTVATAQVMQFSMDADRTLTDVADFLLENHEPTRAAKVQRSEVVEALRAGWQEGDDESYIYRDRGTFSAAALLWRSQVPLRMSEAIPREPSDEQASSFKQRLRNFFSCIKLWEHLAQMNALSMFVTSGGYLGFGSRNVSAGDSVVLTPGARHAFVLAPNAETWKFRWTAWVVGIEDSELVHLWREKELPWKSFQLI